MANNVPFMWIMNVTFAFWYLASLQQTILAISRYALGMVFFAFMGVTAIVYSMRKKDALKGSASALVISGVIVTVFFLYVAYLFLTDTVYLVSNINWEIIIPLWVLGALLYPISRAYYRTKNLDLSLVFKELPPE